ncbi:unnamed protein product [Closterium sp. NIES-54]
MCTSRFCMKHATDDMHNSARPTSEPILISSSLSQPLPHQTGEYEGEEGREGEGDEGQEGESSQGTESQPSAQQPTQTQPPTSSSPLAPPRFSSSSSFNSHLLPTVLEEDEGDIENPPPSPPAPASAPPAAAAAAAAGVNATAASVTAAAAAASVTAAAAAPPLAGDAVVAVAVTDLPSDRDALLSPACVPGGCMGPGDGGFLTHHPRFSSRAAAGGAAAKQWGKGGSDGRGVRRGEGSGERGQGLPPIGR